MKNIHRVINRIKLIQEKCDHRWRCINPAQSRLKKSMIEGIFILEARERRRLKCLKCGAETELNVEGMCPRCNRKMEQKAGNVNEFGYSLLFYYDTFWFYHCVKCGFRGVKEL